uniref:DNA_mis_repair domain-containing protein n=1 Tax=Angiostrongylus cantonensis TaxID=6313 RepID=A0A0K0D9P4_ANGCA
MNEPSTTQREVHHISSDVSARISTAQVIVSVSCAVRQLIDNSLDGCAQVIEIRTKNNGFESVEVIDDGTGIEAESFDSLCKPHATSKLTELNDFGKLFTLGFRGEALNALCALGLLSLLEVLAEQFRKVGTTVVVENLFETLPVRRKEFEITAKKQFGKILTTVQCFSLSRPDVKFICSNILAGKRVQSICTPGKATTREVVFNLFGGRIDKTKMVEIVRCLPSNEVCSIYGLDPKNSLIYADILYVNSLLCSTIIVLSNNDDLKSLRISGFVSSCEHGFGRSTTDRQFIYVNRRAVDYPKVICRVVNEAYQQYNRSQYPTLVLYIELPPGIAHFEYLSMTNIFAFAEMIDVNVTPDKRMVLFDHEKELLALTRASILATFHPLLSSYTSVEDKISKGNLFHWNLSCLIATCFGFYSLENLAFNNQERRKFIPPLMRNLSRGFEHSIEKDSSVIDRMERAIDQREISTEIQKDALNVIFFSMSVLKERLISLRNIRAKEEQASQELEFSASIVPDENKTAEEELNRALKKSDFREMSVIGQFNKGFIVTFLRNHLFLVDQHASDEKYNFERFQKKARVETQRLIQDNKDILEANGFGFEFKDGEDGCTIPLLVSTPVLHSWNFDKSDIEEILAVVSEFPGVMYRPAKLRRIFASRACRKSVMIGTALNTNQMQTIIHHLGVLDQPWNCPHGRPTLRHLADLRNINQKSAAAI